MLRLNKHKYTLFYTHIFFIRKPFWAIGTTTDLSSLNFRNFQDGGDRIIGGTSITNSPTNFDMADVVLYLVKEDIYIDVEFITWQKGNSTTIGNGGGFSYRRATRGEGQ